jgi:L-lactate utilization protein LutC
MKTFTEFLIESSKTYEFRVKVACDCSDDHMERFENQLERFGLESISKPKRTPIQEQPAGFAASVKNTEVSIIDIETNYPATPHQITAMAQEVFNVPESHVVTVNRNAPEELAREEAASSKEGEYEPIIGTEYKDEKQEEVFGDKYNENMLKELETRKYEIEADKK